MFDGNELWGSLLPLQMERRQYNGLTYDLYPGIPGNLYTALCQTVSRYPGKNCIIDDGDNPITYHAFLDRVDRFASYLKNTVGVQSGDHVGLILYNSLEFCVSFLALIKLGAVTLPLPSKFRRNEIEALLDKADPSCIICDPHFREWVNHYAAKGVRILVTGDAENSADGFKKLLDGYSAKDDEVCVAKPESPAILMFTSGTTSLSKGVVLTNFNIMHAVESYRLTLQIVPEDSSIIAVPIYHVTGMIALLGLFLYVGGTLYLHKVFQAKRVLQCVKDHEVTFIHASPTVFSMLLAEKDMFPELPSLRAFACGSSNMPKEKIQALHRWLPGMAFRTVYGLTETSSPATVFPCDAAQSERIGSSGWPIPGTQFRIVGDDGQEVPVGQLGEVQLRGSVVLKEYYNQTLDTLSSDGWLSTGDIGYFTEDGYIFLVDRKKDMINRGGEKICSYDVENELYRMPGITEAAVVGIPDALYGEVAAAMIQCEPGIRLSEEQVREYLKDRIAKYKIPARMIFTDEIPVTPNGKVDKKRIRAIFEEKQEVRL